MKQLVEYLNENLISEDSRNFMSPYNPKDYEELRRQKQDEEAKNKLKAVEYAEAHKYIVDKYRYIYDGAVEEVEELPPVIVIGDVNDDKQICMAIETHRTEFEPHYYYKGICYEYPEQIRKYAKELPESVDKLPDIPVSWRRTTYSMWRKGQTDEALEYIAKNAEKFQKRLKI